MPSTHAPSHGCTAMPQSRCRCGLPYDGLPCRAQIVCASHGRGVVTRGVTMPQLWRTHAHTHTRMARDDTRPSRTRILVSLSVHACEPGTMRAHRRWCARMALACNCCDARWHTAGHTLPVNSGKLFVAINRSSANLHRRPARSHCGAVQSHAHGTAAPMLVLGPGGGRTEGSKIVGRRIRTSTDSGKQAR